MNKSINNKNPLSKILKKKKNIEILPMEALIKQIYSYYYFCFIYTYLHIKIYILSPISDAINNKQLLNIRFSM